MRKKHPLLKKIFIVVLVILCLSIAVIWFLGRETPWKQDTDEIAVLGYHNLARDEDKNEYWRFDPWTSSTSSFKQQLQYLKDNGYHTITLDELYEWRQGKRKLDNKSVVITFDDSYRSTVELAKPLLKEYGFQASTFVIAYSIAKEKETYDASKKQHIPASMLKNDETMMFYSHSYLQHRKIDGSYAVNAYDKKQLEKDVKKAKEKTDTTYWAYPFGKYNETLKTILKKQGTKLAFSYHQFEKMSRDDDAYALPRYSVNAYTPLWLFKIMLNQ